MATIVAISIAEPEEDVQIITVSTGSPGVGVPAGGSTGQVLKKSSATDYATEWGTVSGNGDALTSDGLDQFAATTSAELRSVLSDETGTGAAVFATSPTLVTPILGTPTSGALTNCTAVPAGQIVGVIPIANLATGTPNGSKFIRDDGTLQAIPGGGDALVANSLDQFADVTQTAGKTLAITDNTTLAGGTHSGTNTGDQTSVSGNAGTATALQTARTINGTSFDGTGNITVTAAAGTLTGATLAAGVTASSLLSAAGGSFGTAAFVNTSTLQPVDQDLTDIAALSPTNDDFLQRKSGAWANRTLAQVKSDLALDNVTNHAQTQAAIVPNTAPSDGQILIGGSSVYAKQSVTGAITLSSAGATTVKVELSYALSDETTALTTGTKITFRMPFAMTLTENPRLSVTTAPTGSTIICDVKESGTTIFSTKLTIDATEKTSTTATAAVLSDSSLADDAEMTVILDQVGASVAGTGAKITFIGTRS